MIFDRTIDDVNTAIEILNSLKNGGYFPGLTASEKETLERGTLSLSTLNRIEDKMKELKTEFGDMGYFVGLETKHWSNGDIFKTEDFARILNNIKALRMVFYVKPDTPDTPKARYHFDNLNKIEKILHDLESMIDVVIMYAPQCGNTYCG